MSKLSHSNEETMAKVTRKLTNERGREIAVSISADDGDFVISIIGPNSTVENTLTCLEAANLRDALLELFSDAGPPDPPGPADGIRREYG